MHSVWHAPQVAVNISEVGTGPANACTAIILSCIILKFQSKPEVGTGPANACSSSAFPLVGRPGLRAPIW